VPFKGGCDRGEPADCVIGSEGNDFTGELTPLALKKLVVREGLFPFAQRWALEELSDGGSQIISPIHGKANTQI